MRRSWMLTLGIALVVAGLGLLVARAAAEEKAAEKAPEPKPAAVVGSAVEDTGKTSCDGKLVLKEKALYLFFEAAGKDKAKVKVNTWDERTAEACKEATTKTRGAGGLRPETLQGLKQELAHQRKVDEKTRGCSWRCTNYEWQYYCDYGSGVWVYAKECYDECGNYIGYEYAYGDACS